MRRAMIAALLIAATAPAAAAPDDPPSREAIEPSLAFAFEAVVELEPTVEVGKTPLGTRQRVPITGGTVTGRIEGTILPGGMDWQLIRSDGVWVIEADYMIRVKDGALVHVHNKGLLTDIAAAPGWKIRTSPEFEAPAGSAEWLNRSTFVSSVTLARKEPYAVRVRFYEVR